MTELTEQKTLKQKSKKKSKTKKIVLWSILGVLVLALAAGGIYAWHILKRPDAFFDKTVYTTANATAEPTPIFDISAYLPSDEPGATPIPMPASPVPAIEPIGNPEELIQTGEPIPTEPPTEEQSVETHGIVNIALFGIDAYENGKSTSGSMPHTDANIVLAVNFDTKEVSMISIARDCLTKVTGYSGFYKFNGVFNVGGGMQNPKAGFELSCRTAEEWLGGVSIPYYYGVDFQALIDLVDMIGGIDFDVDITLHTFDGRTIGRGRRHLDGQGVMAYMRMRRSAGGLDSKRTARQRKMLVAIFKKLKQEGTLSMIPDLLKTMGDNVYTNTTPAQTAALANFAKEIDADSIQTYSIQGETHLQYEWAYCFIDQQARKDILKKVYGIDAAPIGYNSTEYEKFLHKDGFRAIQYLNLTKKLFDAVHALPDSAAMSEEQKSAYALCWKDYTDLLQVYRLADDWRQKHYDGKASDEETAQFEQYLKTMRELEKKLKKSGDALNEAFDNPIKLKWNYSTDLWYTKDSVINEVYVDFR